MQRSICENDALGINGLKWLALLIALEARGDFKKTGAAFDAKTCETL